jgi:hypothetical protein
MSRAQHRGRSARDPVEVCTLYEKNCFVSCRICQGSHEPRACCVELSRRGRLRQDALQGSTFSARRARARAARRWSCQRPLDACTIDNSCQSAVLGLRPAQGHPTTSAGRVPAAASSSRRPCRCTAERLWPRSPLRQQQRHALRQLREADAPTLDVHSADESLASNSTRSSTRAPDGVQHLPVAAQRSLPRREHRTITRSR